MEFKGNIAKKIARALYLYFDTVDKIFSGSLRLKANSSGISLFFESSPAANKTLDERIKKIDIARTNLLEGLHAIDELKQTAEENKSELESALLKLQELEQDKAIAEGELEQIKHIASTDISTFQKNAGIQTKNDIKKERVIGFISGVIASLIATAIFIGIKHVVKWYYNLP